MMGPHYGSPDDDRTEAVNPYAGFSNPIDEAVSKEARTMASQSITLPQRGALPEPTRTKVRANVQAYIKRHSLKYAAIARQLSVPSSTLSEVLRGKYKGDPDSILRKLNAWIDDDAGRRNKDKPLGFYETNVFKAIRDAARYAKRHALTDPAMQFAQDDSRIVLAYGPSGCGKTMGAKALVHDDPNAIYVRIRTNGGTAKGVLDAIIDYCKWAGRSYLTQRQTFIMDRLRGSGRLLIIDEAHRLSRTGYEVLRDLADECGIPILLLGTSEIKDRVHRIRAGADKARDDQFCRRVGYTVDLLRGTDGQGGTKRPIFSLDEIVAIFHDDEVRLTDDGAEFLCILANTIGIGSLGMAKNIYHNAMMYARRGPRKVIDRDLLLKSVKRVMMPTGFDLDGPVLNQITDAENALHKIGEDRRAVAG